MTNRFTNAIKTPEMTLTTNGMPTQVSSMDIFVDLFFNMGASRGKDISEKFLSAIKVNPQTALRLLAWMRDVRGGAGERELFRQCLVALEQHDSQLVQKFMPFIPEYGRWDDLFCFKTHEVKQAAYYLIANAIVKGNGLACKWAPRKGITAIELRNHMGLSPKAYRKMFVAGTRVVETPMCANNWTEINYNHVPSIAAKRYQNAFKQHDESGYGEYKRGLVSGESKVNASAIFPYDVLRGTDPEVVNAQWNTLPNYLEKAFQQNRLILPVCDVSGSMSTSAGKNTSLTCMDVCVSLGLYIADKNPGTFNNLICTFSNTPSLIHLTGNCILEKREQLEDADWGMNTNIEATFELVLQTGIKNRVPQDQMPTDIIIFSDMQFDGACKINDTAMQMIQRKYEKSGYKVPRIIFWNLNSSAGVPVSFDKSGAALVSGFSPSIMRSILSSSDFSPVGIMLETIESDRYNMICV